MRSDLRSPPARSECTCFARTRTLVNQPPTTLRFGTGPRCVVEPLKRFAILDQGSAQKRFTDEFYRLDRESVAAVLRGLFTADGTVTPPGMKAPYISLDCV